VRLTRPRVRLPAVMASDSPATDVELASAGTSQPPEAG